MRITCPLCGPRDRREFYYYGSDDYLNRPAEDAAPEAWDDYLHLRDNPAGITRDLWYHETGCASWLRDHAATPSRMRSMTSLWSPTAPRERRAAPPPAEGQAHEDRGQGPDRPQRARSASASTGRTTPAIPGDTLASALLANGVQAGRAQLQVSPPARRADRRVRGAQRAGRGRSRATSRRPNVRATVQEIYDGLDGAKPEPLALAAP